MFELKVLADNGFDIFKRSLGTIGSDDTLKYETVLKLDPISNITYVSFHFDRHPDLTALGYKNDIKKRMYISFWVWWNTI